MSTVSSPVFVGTLVRGEHGLHSTLECGGVALMVERVREQRSLARPPELLVDVVFGPGELPALAREPAALLVESATESHYVQGWVRGVERYADVRVGPRLRIHLVPTTLVGDAGVQAGVESVEPAYVYDPASWAAGAEGDGEGDGEEDTQRFAREELAVALRQGVEPRVQDDRIGREQTIVLDADAGEPEALQVTGTGTELLRREDIMRMLLEGVAAPAMPSAQGESVAPTGAVQGQTERVPVEHVAQLRRAALEKSGAGPASAQEPRRTSQPLIAQAAVEPPQPAAIPPAPPQEGTQPWSMDELQELRRRWEERRGGG